jgi:hypothetical protein
MLIDHPQPTDSLAAAQGHLFAGIHLPDLMRTAGAGRRATGAPAGWCGSKIGPLEPALDGTHHRQGLLGVLAPQHDPNQTGPPGRVFAAHADGLLNQFGGPRRELRPEALVRRGHTLWPLLAKALNQMSNGTRHEAETVSDLARVLAVLPAPIDNLANRGGGRSRHE